MTTISNVTTCSEQLIKEIDSLHKETTPALKKLVAAVEATKNLQAKLQHLSKEEVDEHMGESLSVLLTAQIAKIAASELSEKLTQKILEIQTSPRLHSSPKPNDVMKL